MPCLAILASRTPDQHDRCLLLHLWRRNCQSFQILATDQEGRGQVGGDGTVPSLKRQVYQRDVLRGPNSMVYNEDLHWPCMRDGREHVIDGHFIGEIGLNRLDVGVGL